MSKPTQLQLEAMERDRVARAALGERAMPSASHHAQETARANAANNAREAAALCNDRSALALPRASYPGKRAYTLAKVAAVSTKRRPGKTNLI